MIALTERLFSGYRPTFSPSIEILKSEEVNAFALPGGKIILLKGLIAQAEDPDEIAAIVAHEIQHVEQRHIMSRVVRSALLTGVWNVAFGDYSGLMVVDPATLYEFANLSFSREDELSADRGAVEILRRAGIGTDGFKTFFARLEKKEPAWLRLVSTHPASSDRLRMIASEDPGQSLRPALDEAEWAALKDACRGG